MLLIHVCVIEACVCVFLIQVCVIEACVCY